MKQPLLVYCAGKMGGRSGKEVLAERKIAVDLCVEAGIIPIDPAANEGIDPTRTVDLAMSYEQMKWFVAKDEYAVRKCDALLVLTGDFVSEGTGCEISLAHFLGKPIVMVAPRRRAGALVGFWNIKASKIVDTIEEAVEYLAVNFAEV